MVHWYQTQSTKWIITYRKVKVSGCDLEDTGKESNSLCNVSLVWRVNESRRKLVSDHIDEHGGIH